LRLAEAGVHIVILGKTESQHKYLPDTIYSACTEVATHASNHGHTIITLPIKCDIRIESEVQNAVSLVKAQFGRVDILICNASAIKLTGTAETSMKDYDLMQQVNSRGTYLTIKSFLDLLLKGKNPHVVTNSPPLSFNPLWWRTHMA